MPYPKIPPENRWEGPWRACRKGGGVNTLFGSISAPSQMHKRHLDQFFTPEWAAEQLVSQFFDDLTAEDLVLEPTCGRGAFIKAIPQPVRVIGVEIDPELAAEAQAAAGGVGRRVLCGDFRTIELPELPTQIIGNLPFKVSVLEALLDRARGWLPDNGRCGLIVSTAMVQTPNTVLRWNEDWSIEQRVLPRTLFPRAIRPLIFLTFTKDREKRMLGGFALYRESAEINAIERAARLLLIHGRPGRSCWRAVVEWGLRRLGGKAHLREIYDAIEPHRPTENRWWQEKVRQTLQRHFSPKGGGVWAIEREGVAA